MENTVLRRGEVQSMQLNGGATLRATSGVLWLTFDGESEDILLHRGESWVAPRRGKAVVQALEDGSLHWAQNGKSGVSLPFQQWFAPKMISLKN